MLSKRTIALFIEVLADWKTHTQLGTFFVKMDVDQYGSGGANKQDRVHRVIRGMQSNLSAEFDKKLLNMIQEYFVEGSFDHNWLKEEYPLAKKIRHLIDSLKRDGWEVTEDNKLIPTTPSETPLAPQISGLQQDLQSLSLTVAEKHYVQALDNFCQKNWEASNGQLRSFLENLYIELCVNKTGSNYDDPQAAIQQLQQAGFLDRGEYNIARGLFEASNEHGSHQGLSHEQEALFRFHFSTALGRYLIARMNS